MRDLRSHELARALASVSLGVLLALVFSPPAEAWRLAAWMLAIVLVSGGAGTALVMTRVQRLVDRLAEQEGLDPLAAEGQEGLSEDWLEEAEYFAGLTNDRSWSWYLESGEEGQPDGWYLHGPDVVELQGYSVPLFTYGTAASIASAHGSVPKLVAEVRRLRRVLAERSEAK